MSNSGLTYNVKRQVPKHVDNDVSRLLERIIACHRVVSVYRKALSRSYIQDES